VFACLFKFDMRSCGGSLITAVIPMTVFARRPYCCFGCIIIIGGGGGGGGGGGTFCKNITSEKVACIPQIDQPRGLVVRVSDY
jgi:hypothetical protein